MRRQGVVTAIDRANRVVRATIDEIPEIECTYYSGRREPWPLCHAWFSTSNGSVWHCDGPIGLRRVVFHDDFLIVNAPTSGDGDTPWSSFGTPAAVTGIDATGAIQLVNEERIGKDTDCLALPGDLTWPLLTVRASATPSGSGVLASRLASFTPNGGVNITGVRLEDTESVFRVEGGGDLSGTVVEGTTAVADTFYVFDVMLDEANERTLAWVDGNGPTIVDWTPNIGSPLTVWVVAGAGSIQIDYVTLSIVTPVSVPDV